jgi:major membrane immunogen (membrane-anchored lipoprotein)
LKKGKQKIGSVNHLRNRHFLSVGVNNGKIAAIFEYRNQPGSLLDLFDETNSAAGLNVARVEVKYASIPDKPM